MPCQTLSPQGQHIRSWTDFCILLSIPIRILAIHKLRATTKYLFFPYVLLPIPQPPGTEHHKISLLPLPILHQKLVPLPQMYSSLSNITPCFLASLCLAFLLLLTSSQPASPVKLPFPNPPYATSGPNCTQACIVGISSSSERHSGKRQKSGQLHEQLAHEFKSLLQVSRIISIKMVEKFRK